MRSEKEIEKRVQDITGFLSLAKEFTQVNPNQINKLKKEVMVLNWVLGVENLNEKPTIPSDSHVQDSIIVFLRDQSEPVPLSEILYHTGNSPGSIGMALRTLATVDTIKRTGKSEKYLYSINDTKEVDHGD